MLETAANVIDVRFISNNMPSKQKRKTTEEGRGEKEEEEREAVCFGCSPRRKLDP